MKYDQDTIDAIVAATNGPQTWSEIARQFGISKNAVAGIVHRARRGSCSDYHIRLRERSAKLPPDPSDWDRNAVETTQRLGDAITRIFGRLPA